MTLARDNSFDHLRLLASGMVVFSHALRVFALGDDPTARVFPGQDLSSLGVIIFFGVSGYLVTQSAMRNEPGAFVRNRMLRILPGLVVCVLLTAFVIGALGSTLSYANYISHPRTWLYLLNLPLFALQPTLPNAFSSNPWSNNVNGSLWTLVIEVSAYGMMFWAVFLLRRIKAAIAVGMVITGALHLVFATSEVPDVVSVVVGGNIFIFYLNVFGASYLLFAFLVGAALNWVRLFDLRVAGGLLAVSVLLPHTLIICIAVVYAAVTTGRMRAPFRMADDLSYGVYLYHLPVLQLTWLYLHEALPVPVMISVGLTFVAILAYLSWVLVERPFLKLKSRTNSSHRLAPLGSEQG